MWIWIAIVCAVGLVAFGVWRQYFQTYHLAEVDPEKLYRDGNRGPREFATMLRNVRPKSVVMLIDDNELVDPDKPEFQAELDLLKQQGVALHRVPISLGGWPTTQSVEDFLAIVTDAKNQPAVVHCAQGVRRTGMLVAAYQESVLGYDDDRAKTEILRFGHSDRSIGDVKRFIDIYEPKARVVRESLPMSRE